jgi:hypothetical protein
VTRKAEKNPICTRCGQEITGALGWSELHGLYPRGLCVRCLDDSFSCPRCNRTLAKSENRAPTAASAAPTTTGSTRHDGEGRGNDTTEILGEVMPRP